MHVSDYKQFLSSFQSGKFQQLRKSQSYILAEYATNYVSNKDVAIELPTGSGKTLIALLIAEAWRQKNRKVAILSANKTLARQMEQEAQALGIPVALMEGRGVDISSRFKRDYQRTNRIAVMNYWVYFNQNPVIDPADLLVMDDAHLAEHCLNSLYSVEIRRSDHENLFKQLIIELQARFPEYSILTDALSGNAPSASAPELLSFIDQTEVVNRIREIIDASPCLDSDIDLNFRWRRIRSQLNEVNIYLSLNSIWIRPYIYPLISNQHYSQPQQRLYMSATIGESGDLSRRLGVRKITKIPTPTEHKEATLGHRLIVMNQIEDADIPDRLGSAILAGLRIHPKSVWLCSSEIEAQKFKQVVSKWLDAHGLKGHPSWLLTPLGDEISQFKTSSKGHLFVAGRFDGMDFQADECRLVILTTIPRAINTQEEFVSAYLRDSSFMLERLNQRIVQALGRCNRSDKDYGVYVLADRRFASHFSRESNRVGIQRNMIAEIDMAQDDAEISEKDLVHKVERFLQGDFVDYDRSLENYLEDVPSLANQLESIDTSNNEVIGWASLYESKNYKIAADKFEKCWDTALAANLKEICALYGWQWAKALYLQSLLNEPTARERSLDIFEQAIKRGGSSSWFNRMWASLNRARQTSVGNEEIISSEYSVHLFRTFDDLLENLGTSGKRFERRCQKITTLLQSESHAQFQEGLEILGQTLGYYAARPKYGAATDCIWRGAFGNEREVFTFEAKIEHISTNNISASNVGQAHNQYTRAINEYESSGYSIRGTIVTHLTTIEPDALVALGNIKIINKDAILVLWERVRVILSQYRNNWSLHNIPDRVSSAQSIKSKIPSTGWLIRILDKDNSFITSEDMLSEWLKN